MATGAPLLLEVTLDGVRPTKVLHLVERRTVGGVEQLVPLAEGFLPFSEDDPRVRVLGAVVTDGDARRELPTAPARCKKGT